MTNNIHTQINDLVKNIQTYISDSKIFTDYQEIVENFYEESKEQEEKVIHALIEKFKVETNFSHLNIISYLLSLYESSYLKNSILELLSKPGLNDSSRYRLILVLQQYTDFSFSHLHNYYDDKVKLVNYAIYHLTNQIENDGSNLDDVTQKLNGSETFFCELVSHLSFLQRKKSIWILGYLAEFSNEKISLAAIESLKKQNSPTATKILNNLIFNKVPNTEQTSKDQQKIKMMDCFLSWLDSYNNRMVIFTYQTTSEKMAASFFMINEERGIQSSLTLDKLEPLQLKNIIEKWTKSIDIKNIDVSFAKVVLEDALWKNKDNKLPLPASFILRDILPSAEIEPKKYHIDLEKMDLASVKKNQQSLQKSSSFLLKEFPFNQWWFDTPECYEYISEKVGNEKNIKYEVLKDFTTIFFENKKESFAKKFLITADFMHLLSAKNYQKQIATSLALYLSLTENNSTINIPFIKQLVLLNIRNIQEKTYEK